MEVEDLIKRAWGAVRDAGVPEPLQEFAFKRAIEHLSQSAQTTPVQESPRAPENTTPEKLQESAPPKEKIVSSQAAIFEKFAVEAEIPAAELQEVFYFDDSGPHLNSPRSKYGSSIAEQAKAVALAITAARNYALDEVETSADVIRAECARLKCDPKRNWSTVMGSLSSVSYGGPTGGKVTRVKNSSHESLRALVTKVRGAEPSE